MNITEWEEPARKDQALCDPSHVTLWERQAYGDSGKSLVAGAQEARG